MAHKEDLERDIAILKRNIESPVLQCDPHIAMISRNATRSNCQLPPPEGGGLQLGNIERVD